MSDDQHSSPDEPPVYRVTLAEQLADAPITWYDAAPDLDRPRHTVNVSDLLDAATHRLDRRYPLQPHQPEEMAVQDTVAALDELRAIVEILCERVAAIEGRPR